MRCEFYEVTGNQNCPFHEIVLLPTTGIRFSMYNYAAYPRVKTTKRRSKTRRRVYGKSR